MPQTDTNIHLKLITPLFLVNKENTVALTLFELFLFSVAQCSLCSNTLDIIQIPIK